MRKIVFIALFIQCLHVSADTQQVIDYEYDAAGNIIAIRAAKNLGPPDVTSISPPFINKETISEFTATGVNLANAGISLSATGITLVETISNSDTEIRFSVAASNDAITGALPVTFTTRLGSDTENLIIAERTPVIATFPNPISLTPNAVPVEVILAFDQPFLTDQV
ncbi:MAG: hypothetical protein RLT30_06190, partial [Gammaproteobacteria bacterium]